MIWVIVGKSKSCSDGRAKADSGDKWVEEWETGGKEVQVSPADATSAFLAQTSGHLMAAPHSGTVLAEGIPDTPYPKELLFQ